MTALTPSIPPDPDDVATPGSVSRLYEDEFVIVELVEGERAADTIAVTFDPIMVDFSQPPYAGEFLRKAGVDLLCVRKKSEHFYQPFPRERFDEVARPVLARYRRRLAYGSSLGAYAVLHYCQHGFDTVIASSPRVSAHPRFGFGFWQQRVTFEHADFDPQQPASSGAVIFYDPHDGMDRRFVEVGIRPSWPNARIVRVPYAGHPANQFLSEIGFIAPFVRAIIAGTEPPPLERRHLKTLSASYRRVLAEACLQHRKPLWAEQLCLDALRMTPGLLFGKRALGQALLAQGRLDEAEPLLREFALRYPQDGVGAAALKSLSLRRSEQARGMRALAPVVRSVRRVNSKVRRIAAHWRRRIVSLTERVLRGR